MILQRQSSLLLVAISLLGFVFFTMYNSQRNETQAFELISKIRNNMGGGSGCDCSDSLKLKELSETLKNKLQQLGQLSCEIAKDDTSVNGGWCAKISGAGGGQHVTDTKLVPYLSKFLKGKRVASFGDGPGIYKQELLKLNEVSSYDAFDGAPFTEKTTEGRCQFLDLSVPVYHLDDKYDWIISTEVAEHIPKKFEKNYLDNLARYAKEGVIMSWAKLGQGGHSHVNNQDLSYVKEQMSQRGLHLSQKLSDEIKRHTKLGWLTDNLNVYLRGKS